MITEIIFLLVGLALGGAATWTIAKLIAQSKTISKSEFDSLLAKLSLCNTDLSVERERVRSLTETLRTTEGELGSKGSEVTELSSLLSSKTMESLSIASQFEESKEELIKKQNDIGDLRKYIQGIESELATVKANLGSASAAIQISSDDLKQLKKDLQSKTEEFNEANKKVAEYSANNKSLVEKLQTQKSEIEDMRKQFNTEFENIATRILDDKTKKFTDLNKDNLETILGPLGEKLKSFKDKVEEVYDKESKERFSLGREVEKLVLANLTISQEANNLTNALTSKGKTQGDWGQMILENILEKSGLAKDREYFVQEYLKDDAGVNLVNELGQKMQPDVIIAYPDNRKVIVDSKVSLTAYNRYSSATSKEEEVKALAEHHKSLRAHIDGLSAKNYQDFAPSLDFVMMFVPIEPAYLIAIHTDQDLWSYAYNKRILLTSPSNLIVALKMIVDLWKRDNQSKNHQAIVERGGKLYDKFFAVLENLKDIGTNLKATQRSYNSAVSQLSEGNDNVLRQVEKLKTLGAKAKKSLPEPDTLPLLEVSTVVDNGSVESTAE